MLGVPEPRCVCGNTITIERQPDEATPRWVRFVAWFASDADQGIGDTVARYAAKLGGELFKAWAARIGLPCGCVERQADWNARWPYRPS